MKNKLVQARGRILCLMLILSGIIALNNNNSSITTVQAASGSFTEDFTTINHMDIANTNTSGWGGGEIKSGCQKPSVVGALDTIGNAYSVDIKGDYAYIATQDNGLQVVNINDPTNPILVGTCPTYDKAYDVFISGNLAYLADYTGDISGNNFLVIDVTNPSSPFILSDCATSDVTRSVYVEGNYAYVANGPSGLTVVNITDPYNPINEGVLDTDGIVYDVVVEGNYAYVADGSNGLNIVNITNPTQPELVSNYVTSSLAVKIKIEGNYAYVVDTDGLFVINITNPTVPSYAGFYNVDGASSIALEGDFAYVTDISNGLTIIDINNPSSLSKASSCDILGLVYDVEIWGCYAYITSYEDGLQVLEISDLTSITQICYYYEAFIDPKGVEFVENYAYIVAGTDFLILDVNDPTNPTIVAKSSFAIVTYAEDISISGDFAYIADRYDGLIIINITDPFSPNSIASFSTPGTARGVCVAGDYAYIADGGSGLTVIDITNPFYPLVAGTVDTPGEAHKLHIEGEYAYVADWNSGLQVIDISDPTSPFISGSYDTPGAADQLSMEGNYAYIADIDGGLQIINITNPVSPSLIYNYNPAEFDYTMDVCVHDNYLFLALGGGITSRGELRVLDVANPASPIYIRSRTTHPWATFVRVWSDYVFVGNFDWDMGEIAPMYIFEYKKTRARLYEPSSISIAQSIEIPTGTDSYFLLSATLTALANIPTETSITYYLSADNGIHWELVTSGSEHFFSYTGVHLKWKIILSALDAVTSSSVSSLSISYKTKLESPSLLSPSDFYTTNDNTPSFLWSAVLTATNYLIQIDNTITFDSVNLINQTTGTTSYTISSPLFDGIYYWRVAPIDPEGDIGVFSAYRSILIDTTLPLFISHPSDFSYEEGTTNNEITWIVGDANPLSYTVTRNGASIVSTSWDGNSITIDIDSLSSGVYTFNCKVYDKAGNSANDIVEVTVFETINPLIDHPADISYEEGTTGHSISWTATDANPGTYVVYLEGTELGSDSWTSGVPITIYIDGLSEGSYNFTIVVFDTSGNQAIDTVIVNVNPAIPEFEKISLNLLFITPVVIALFYKKQKQLF